MTLSSSACAAMVPLRNGARDYSGHSVCEQGTERRLGWLEMLFVNARAGAIHERHLEAARSRIGFKQSTKLQACIRWPVGFQIGRRAAETHLGTKCHVERPGRERAGMRGTGDEFPEGIERRCRG